jgi:hypothetical protein
MPGGDLADSMASDNKDEDDDVLVDTSSSEGGSTIRDSLMAEIKTI